MKSYKTQRRISLTLRYILLALLAIVWIFPIIWIVLASLTQNNTGFVSTIIPKTFTFENYIQLFQNKSGSFPFVSWIINTFIVAVISATLSTFITIIMSYTLSRLRFAFRKPFLQIALVLGMFPGFMSMIALYYILKAMNMLNLGGLILVYVGGAGLGFYIAKGFFDTIPYSLDESAMIDGATRFQIFRTITLPLSKPIIVYTALMAFMGPWVDFIFASVILGDVKEKYTVALGLFQMLNKDAINKWFLPFTSGAIIIAIPITLLFIFMQKYYVEGVTGGAVK